MYYHKLKFVVRFLLRMELFGGLYMTFIEKISGTLKTAFKLTGKGLTTGEKFRVALPGPILSIGGVLIHNVFIKFYTDIIGLPASSISVGCM